MRKQRRTYRLADKAALLLAALFLGVTLMVRDGHPVVAAAPATPPQSETPLAMMLIFLTFGLSVAAYGFYHERHRLRELARVRMVYTRHRLGQRLRIARRGLTYASIRRAMQRA
jgi:hypothetical protein